LRLFFLLKNLFIEIRRYKYNVYIKQRKKMKKKLCNFRFDSNFIKTLEQLAYLEATSKTEIIKRAVFEYSDANMIRLEERYEKMNLSSED